MFVGRLSGKTDLALRCVCYIIPQQNQQPCEIRAVSGRLGNWTGRYDVTVINWRGFVRSRGDAAAAGGAGLRSECVDASLTLRRAGSAGQEERAVIPSLTARKLPSPVLDAGALLCLRAFYAGS